MSTSGDRDKVIEAALSLGRKVEVFVAEEKNVEGVQNRVREAFDMAWNDGLFKVRYSRVDILFYFQGSCVETAIFSLCTVDPYFFGVHIFTYFDAWFNVYESFMGSCRFQLSHATAARIVLSHTSPMSRTGSQKSGLPFPALSPKHH